MSANTTPIPTSLGTESIAFVDNNISQSDTLLSGLQVDRVFILNDQTNAIDQITQALAKYQNLNNIHIFSHGSENTLQFANGILAEANLNDYEDELAAWGNALSHNGDLLFYGCNIAASGDDFINRISQITQADVAASDDLTGHTDLGGDWDLEVTTGQVDTVLAVETYQGILPRYIRFVANSEVNGNPWTSAAELNVLDANGNEISQQNWSLVSVNSQEVVASNTPATAAFDGNNSTFWHTEWAAPGNANDPAHDHQLVIDLGAFYDISGFTYLSRQDASQNGQVADYQFFAADNTTNWGKALATGTLDNTKAEQTVQFGQRYIRFVANSEVNGNPWTSMAELNVLDANGNEISQQNWSLVSVNSQEVVASNTPATAAFDGNNSTFWHTEWAAPGNANDPVHDHELVIDLGAFYDISGFTYLSRQDASQNGQVADYQFFAADNTTNWGKALAIGTLDNTKAEQIVRFFTDPAPTEGLVGYWQFNELTHTTQLVDASGNGNSGTNVNISPGNTSYSGPINSAPIFDNFNPRSWNFDGVNDYVSIGNSPDLNFSNGQFTQSVWIRPTVNDNAYHGILGYQDGGGVVNRAPGLWVVGKTRIHAGFGDGNNWNNFTTDNVLKLNEWNHVVSSFDGTNYKIYVDGREVYSTDAFAGRKPANVQRLDIGRVDNYFKGQIDEVRLYNRGLDTSEIQQLYFEQPDKAQVGDWSGPIDLPNIPVAAAVLPNGFVVSWSSWDRFTFGGRNSPRQSYTSIWNPKTGEVSDVLVTNTLHDMFCPGIAMLADGRLLAMGGGEFVNSTSIYDFETGTWSDGPDMDYRRWYNSALTLGNGDVFTIGGEWNDSGTSRINNGLGEVWNETTGWRTLTGAPINPIATSGDRGTEHPQLFLAPNGKVFAAGPSPMMYWYDPTGSGSISEAGLRGDSPYSQVGAAVMYDTGKILFAGGANTYQNSPGYQTAYTIDINNENAIRVEKQDSMDYQRFYHTGVVLPDGKVLAVGGQQSGRAFTDNKAVYRPELWDPETGEWTLMDNHEIPRTYHSTALLLPDGRVMAGGGGLAGAGNPVNHFDAEIFTPPYLYNEDGTLAERPVIAEGTDRIGYNQSFSISMNPGMPITKFNLVRMSAVTHGINTDQRFLSVDIIAQNGNTYTLNAPQNGNIAPPGYYMLFALNEKGVPSEAKIIQIS